MFSSCEAGWVRGDGSEEVVCCGEGMLGGEFEKVDVDVGLGVFCGDCFW